MPAFDLKSLADVLAEVVDKVFKAATPPVLFSEKPVIQERDIIEYHGKMRVSGMEIFNGPTYISAVNFYPSAKDQQENKACGAVVMYLEEGNSEILLKALGQKNIDEDDNQAILNSCADGCKIISERFKTELTAKGYGDLFLSAPKNYHNYVPPGIDFSLDQYKKYELNFLIKGRKVLAVDLTMAPIKGR